MNTIPEPVKKAIRHVQSFHPEVTTVLIATSGRWLFVDDDNRLPMPFSKDISTGILEDMETGNMDNLPVVYRLPPRTGIEDIEEFVEQVFPSAQDDKGDLWLPQEARIHLREALYNIKQ